MISISQDNRPSGKLIIGKQFKLSIPTEQLVVVYIYLYKLVSGGISTYKTIKTSNKTVDVIFYDDVFSDNNNDEFIFSTSSTFNFIFDPFGDYNSKSEVFKILPFCTSVSVTTIDLNQTNSGTITWSSVDIGIDYTNTKAYIVLYKSDSTFFKIIGEITYGSSLQNAQFSRLQTGNYFFICDFAYNVNVGFSYGTNKKVQSSNFRLTTQSIQSISAKYTSPTATITGNFGDYGYTGSIYTLLINNVSIKTSTFPFTYNFFILPNNETYTATILDFPTLSATFTRYVYVISITIDNKIIQSLQNFISWEGGGSTERFKYNTTQLTTNGSTIFNQESPTDTNNFTPGTGYTILPYDDTENNGNYKVFYFDSIPRESTLNNPTTQKLTITGSNGPFWSNSTLSWVASYTSSTPAGFREYSVKIGTYEDTSTYNTLDITDATLNYGVPYTIQVVDIIIATNYVFYEKPYNVIIYPGYINYPNTIIWTSSTNPELNVQIGEFTIKSKSPFTTLELTQAKTVANDSIKFWPDTSSLANGVSFPENTVTENTFTFWNGGIFPLFQSISFSVELGEYLYPNDTFSLVLNDVVLEPTLYCKNGSLFTNSEFTIPFIWKPYTYVADYQANDQLKLKSNGHVNYGLSSPFTFQANANVTLDNTTYSIFSTITSTLHIGITDIPNFDIYLYSPLDKFDPVKVSETNSITNTFELISISGLNSTFLNTDVYLSYRLVNSPNFYTIQSPIFQLNTGTVLLDQPNYTIISTIVSRVNIPIQKIFTVQLKGGTQYDLGTTVNKTFSFKAYPFAKTPFVNTNVYLQFSLITSPSITIRSPDFQISSTYFTLNKPATLTPEFARATSNEICLAETRKKNNVPTTTISIRNNVAILGTLKDVPHFAVPCGVISHLPELNALLKTITVRTAILFIIQKYSIPIPTTAIIEQKRYKYPTADAVVQYPILQYSTTFRLGDTIVGPSINTIPDLAEKRYDARLFSIVNNDTKTVSSYYTDMLVNATYWLNTLPPLAYDGAYFYCVARPTNGSLKQIITATICLLDNQLIFTPVILRIALLFYVPYQEGDITILYSSARITDVIYYLKSKYYKTFLDDTTAL